jgi:hypothetical protein
MRRNIKLLATVCQSLQIWAFSHKLMPHPLAVSLQGDLLTKASIVSFDKPDLLIEQVSIITEQTMKGEIETEKLVGNQHSSPL